ncbi:hypothetical protein P9112_001031 [Eukaryota sp. TZLM1-RC]
MVSPSITLSLCSFYQEILSQLDSSTDVSQDILEILDLVFPSQLEPALQLIDQKAVHVYECQDSGRQISLVQGRSTVYLVLNEFCSCPAFTYTVLKDTSLLCKHQLAVRLFKAFDFPFEHINDYQMGQLMTTHSRIPSERLLMDGFD